MSNNVIKFSNLGWQIDQLSNLKEDIWELVQSGNYVSSNRVKLFEENFSLWTNSKYSIAVNSGTSALHAILASLDLKQEDEVIVPSHTFIASVNAVLMAGATPVLVDCDDHGLIDKNMIASINTKTRVVMPVHLYGSVVSEELLIEIKNLGIKIVEDASQAHGARFESKKMVGSYGDASAYSLYPGKNLGGIGEGGVITTNSEDLSEKIRPFRNWGTTKRYHHDTFGINYRMDEIQALVLNRKLEKLTDWNTRRREIANYYIGNIHNLDLVNNLNGEPVFHQFVIRHSKRDALQEFLQKRSIETLIHYPIPNHLQVSLVGKFNQYQSLDKSENLANSILSLPIYPGLSDLEVEKIIEEINNFG